MIKEWLEHLVTPCPKWARKMGYVCDLLNVRGRQKRCRDTWRSHLEKSQGVIRAAVKECAKRRKAVILGSGWLFDVPLDALADKFRQVMLVDVVHPLQSLKTARQYPNVRAVRADLTGIGNACFEAAWRPEEKLPDRKSVV